MNSIKILDKNGNYNNWTIDYDMGYYYEISHGSTITALRKDDCFIFEDNLISNKIRNLYKDEDTVNISMGSEICSVCGKEVKNLNRLKVFNDTDEYVCIVCTKYTKIKTKHAIN